MVNVSPRASGRDIASHTSKKSEDLTRTMKIPLDPIIRKEPRVDFHSQVKEKYVLHVLAHVYCMPYVSQNQRFLDGQWSDPEGSTMNKRPHISDFQFERILDTMPVCCFLS